LLVRLRTLLRLLLRMLLCALLRMLPAGQPREWLGNWAPRMLNLLYL
jgi:hypothetical protein